MEINLGKQPFDLDFHPSSPLVAAALISGELHLYRYDEDSQPERLLQISAHEESCRAVRFIDSGRVVLTASPDCSILATDVETGNRIARLENAHEDGINRLVTLTETTIASGDDEGCIKVWDTRDHNCCNSFDAHEDYISDMTYVLGSRQLLATSGDGTLSVCSLRKNKLQARSEFSEDELLSLLIMKDGKKVVCGTQNGPLLLYSWGHFEDCSDRLLGHPMSVDALLKLDENTLISGSEDGVIRLVGVLPNRIIQPLAEHSEYPIESLAFSYDRKFLGSISYDQMLKPDSGRIASCAVEKGDRRIEELITCLHLWDLEELLSGHHNEPTSQEVEVEDDDSDDMDVDIKPNQPAKGSKAKKAGKNRPSNGSATNFFADL